MFSSATNAGGVQLNAQFGLGTIKDNVDVSNNNSNSRTITLLQTQKN